MSGDDQSEHQVLSKSSQDLLWAVPSAGVLVGIYFPAQLPWEFFLPLGNKITVARGMSTVHHQHHLKPL